MRCLRGAEATKCVEKGYSGCAADLACMMLRLAAALHVVAGAGRWSWSCKLGIICRLLRNAGSGTAATQRAGKYAVIDMAAKRRLVSC